MPTPNAIEVCRTDGTDGTDAFDTLYTLYIGCEKFPQNFSPVIALSGVL